jgi:NADPH:quinone reductase-like Zn-dependent oxidoreductase
VVALKAAPVDPATRRADVSYPPVDIRPDGGRLETVLALVAAGSTRPVMAGTWPLEAWAEAYARVERGDAAGKVVLRP